MKKLWLRFISLFKIPETYNIVEFPLDHTRRTAVEVLADPPKLNFVKVDFDQK